MVLTADSSGLKELEKDLQPTGGKKEKKDAKINRALLHQAVHTQLMWRRQRSSNTKTRSEVHGTSKKSIPQKGTGGARHGALTAPQMIGGGVAHGPKPVEFGFKMNRRAFRQALTECLRLRLEEKKMLVVQGDAQLKGKTKEVAEFLKKNASARTLFCVASGSPLERAAKNMARSKVVRVEGLNPYDILTHEWVVWTSDALKKFMTEEKAKA